MMTSYRIVIVYLLLWCAVLSVGLPACSGRAAHTISAPADTSVVAGTMDYAQGFTLETRDGITLLTVTNPWQGAKNVRYRYALCPKGTTIPKEYAQYTIIYTPVERVICLATTHVGILSALGKASSIKALSGAAFVSDTLIGKGIREGEIVDIGYDQGMNYEKIIGLNADVVFAYGVGEEAVGSMGRLASLGQTVVFNAEYLERTALGKAEWIKFMAAFYGCLPQATQQFDSIRREYEQLRELAKSSGHRPKILCGLPWQGIWYVPGGNSWMAGMIADAGGNYLWNDHPSHEGIPINIETVAGRGASADLWINTGAARTLDEIRSVDARLAEIAPFRAGAAYNNYARVSPGGGNDFFESGTVRPQIILKDLIRIFHPDLLPNHSLYYYMKLD